jgi:hypothetical protein
MKIGVRAGFSRASDDARVPRRRRTSNPSRVFWPEDSPGQKTREHDETDAGTDVFALPA